MEDINEEKKEQIEDNLAEEEGAENMGHIENMGNKENVENVENIEEKKENINNIEVLDPIFKDKKHQYPIRGIDAEGAFNVLRRYSDFFLLRQALIARWPGIYIPELPPKKALGNKEELFVTERHIFLNLFCKKIEQYTFLSNSEEYKIFLRGSEEFKKLLSTVSLKQHPEEVVKRFRLAFERKKNSMKKNKELDYVPILDFNNSINSMLGILENMGKLASDNKQIRKKQNNIYNTFILELTKYEKKNIYEYAKKDKKKLILGKQDKMKELKSMETQEKDIAIEYEGFELWIKGEIMDIKAFKSTIDGLNLLKSQRQKLTEKYATTQNNIEKLNQGKSVGVKMLFGGNKEKEIDNLQTQLPIIDKELECTTVTFNLAVDHLKKVFIGKFKENHLKKYYTEIKNYSQFQKQYLEKVFLYMQIYILGLTSLEALPQ